MSMTPIAGSETSAESITIDLRKAQAHTQISEVHQTGESDDPAVHGINNIATIKLEEQRVLYARVIDLNAELTIKPSASQLFRRNITFGTTLIAFGEMENRYPRGPGSNTPSTPENFRPSMLEIDKMSRHIVVNIVTNENMAVV